MSKRYSEYKIGDKAWDGRPIDYIYSVTADYMIYRCGNAVRARVRQGENNTLHISNEVSTLRALIADDVSTNEHVFSRQAKASQECLEGNFDSAKNIMDKLIGELTDRKKMTVRTYYQGTCLIIVLLNVVTVLFLRTNISIIDQGVIFLYNIATLGCLGGFLSVSLNINKLEIDIYGKPFPIILTAISRMFIAMVCSLLVYFFIKSNLILGFINKIDSIPGIYAMAILAGFSETFVPNMLRGIEKQKDE